MLHKSIMDYLDILFDFLIDTCLMVFPDIKKNVSVYVANKTFALTNGNEKHKVLLYKICYVTLM